MGAFDFVAKPGMFLHGCPRLHEILISKDQSCCAEPRGKYPHCSRNSKDRAKRAPDLKKQPTRFMAIGVSTGGPQAVQYVLGGDSWQIFQAQS